MALRSFVHSTYYTPASINPQTVNVPTNAVLDIMLLRVFLSVNTTLTWPSGFTELTAAPFITNRGIHRWAWKRVTGSPDSGTYTLTPAASTEMGIIAEAWSGRITTGTPFTFTTQASNGTQAAPVTQPTAVSGTAVLGDDLAYYCNNYDSNTGYTVSGFTSAIAPATDGASLWKAENVTAGSKTAQASAVATATQWWVSLAAITVAPPALGIPNLMMAPPRSRW